MGGSTGPAIKVKTSPHHAVALPLGQLFGHLPEFIPGFGNIRFGQPGFLPHIFIIENAITHIAVGKPIYLSITYILVDAHEILGKILNGKAVRIHLIDHIVLI